MANFTPPNAPSSPGLMGLPHFRSSRVSRLLYEPVYQNLFTVTIQLPYAVQQLLDVGGGAEAETNLVLEGVRKIDGLDTQKVPEVATQRYKFASRRFANSGPNETTLDLSLDFEINLRHQLDVSSGTASSPSMYTLRVLRMWDDLIYDPLTGTQGLKVEYVAPSMEIIMHDKKGNPFWVWKCYHVFPNKKLNAPALNFDNKELYKVTGYGLACDYWDEAML